MDTNYRNIMGKKVTEKGIVFKERLINSRLKHSKLLSLAGKYKKYAKRKNIDLNNIRNIINYYSI